MDKLNNINLTHLIEFFTFPVNRFLSGVITGSEQHQKIKFIKQLISDAEDEYSDTEHRPVFVILEFDDKYTKFDPNINATKDILDNISQKLPEASPGLDCKNHILALKKNLLLIFNEFDTIHKAYREQISQVIETLFLTTDNGSTVKINMLFLINDHENVFDYFTEESAVKVSSMKLPIYNFDYIST